MLVTDPCEVADEDAVLPVGFPGVDGTSPKATHTLRGSLAVNPSLYHTSFLLGIVASRGGACLENKSHMYIHGRILCTETHPKIPMGTMPSACGNFGMTH